MVGSNKSADIRGFNCAMLVTYATEEVFLLQHAATQCNTHKNIQLRQTVDICEEIGVPDMLTVTRCNTLQHAATRCNTLQHTVTRCTRCNTLQHAATRCNTLQHAATRSEINGDILVRCGGIVIPNRYSAYSYYNTLQHTCNT